MIIPVYKTPVDKFELCMQKIADNAKTFDDFEVVIIDDHSEKALHDTYVSIANEKAEKTHCSFTIVINKSKGVSSARNYGVKLAKGEYVTFVDSDDYIDPLMLKKMAKVVKDKNADLVIAGIRKNEDDYVSTIDPSRLHGEVFQITEKEKYELLKGLYIRETRRFRGYVGTSTAQLIKRQIMIDKNILFDEDIKTNEDVLFDIKLLSNIDHDKIYILNEQLYYYITYLESTTKKYWKNMWQDVFPLVNKLDSYEFQYTIDNIDTNYRFIEAYWTILRQDVLNETVSNKEQSDEFYRLVNEPHFKARLRMVSVKEMWNILKIYGVVTMLAKLKCFYLTKKAFNTYVKMVS